MKYPSILIPANIWQAWCLYSLSSFVWNIYKYLFVSDININCNSGLKTLASFVIDFPVCIIISTETWIITNKKTDLIGQRNIQPIL